MMTGKEALKLAGLFTKGEKPTALQRKLAEIILYKERGKGDMPLSYVDANGFHDSDYRLPLSEDENEEWNWFSFSAGEDVTELNRCEIVHADVTEYAIAYTVYDTCMREFGGFVPEEELISSVDFCEDFYFFACYAEEFCMDDPKAPEADEVALFSYFYAAAQYLDCIIRGVDAPASLKESVNSKKIADYLSCSYYDKITEDLLQRFCCYKKENAHCALPFILDALFTFRGSGWDETGTQRFYCLSSSHLYQYREIRKTKEHPYFTYMDALVKVLEDPFCSCNSRMIVEPYSRTAFDQVSCYYGYEKGEYLAIATGFETTFYPDALYLIAKECFEALYRAVAV